MMKKSSKTEAICSQLHQDVRGWMLQVCSHGDWIQGSSRAAGSETSPLFWAGLSMLKSPFQMTVRSTGRLLISIPSYEYCSHGNRVRQWVRERETFTSFVLLEECFYHSWQVHPRVSHHSTQWRGLQNLYTADAGRTSKHALNIQDRMHLWLK